MLRQLLHLDACKQRMLRLVSEVADMENWLGPARRKVDPVFQHRRRRNVGFVRDLVKAGFVGFVETAGTRWSFLRCQEYGGSTGSSLMLVRATDIF